MRRMPGLVAAVFGLVVGAGVAGAQSAPGNAPTAPSHVLIDYGVMPRDASRRVLIEMPAVGNELRLSNAQKTALESAYRRQVGAMQTARKEFQKNKDSRAVIAARTAADTATDAVIRDTLTPRQTERLGQIQLQMQGPLALSFAASRQVKDGPPLAQRLGLSDDQASRAGAIAADGIKEIAAAAVVPITIDTSDGAPSPEMIRTWVAGLVFQAAKHKAVEAARAAWDAVNTRIEGVMTDPQRAAYRERLGPPFDLNTIRYPGDDEASADAEMVAAALSGGSGQRSDPNFDTKVARPAYTDTHPRVFFDEAHHNFHTTGGRYKPFADLVANDGYKVSPNGDPFTREDLAGAEVLVIANALGAEGMGQPGATNSAFTDAECDAVRDWVRDGGSLLLITDHAPFGSAAESLAGRFGVGMSKGYTSDPANSEGGETWLVFNRTNTLLGDHPITAGRDESERVNRVQTFTGQSLKGPADSVAILKLGDSAFDEGDDGKPVKAAGRSQGLAFPFGKGRVVVLGEAAELSAQLIGSNRIGMNVPGLDNRQLALNVMHWLSGLLEPRGGPPK